LLVVMVILALFCMLFKPYGGIYVDGVWRAAYTLDPLYPLRVVLILAGLAGGVISIGLLVWETARAGESIDLNLQLSMTLASLAIGWAAFPYWVNGVFQAYIGNAPTADFDPQALMPANWINPVWYGTVVGLFLVSIVAVPPVIVCCLLLSVRSRNRRKLLASALWLSITFALFWLSPHYAAWLWD